MKLPTALLAFATVAATPIADPLLKPIAPEAAARWLGPQGPVHIYGNTYLVGPAGLSLALIRTRAGLILIDGAVPQAVPMIEANIRALGLRMADVKLILSTEPHWDHASGLAGLLRDSGATVVAGAAATRVLAGGADPADPQGPGIRYPAPAHVRAAHDGETIRLGDVSVVTRAVPGHTTGSTSWTWDACEGGQCRVVVFSASLNPVAAEGYRFSDPAHAGIVRAFRASFARTRVLPCDILLSSHPDASGLDAKIAAAGAKPAANPFVDPGACRAFADSYEKKLDETLAAERALPKRR